MRSPAPDTPCSRPRLVGPLPGGQPVRVIHVLASGTNGGAQEHVHSLVSRLDVGRYNASVVSLGPGSAVRKLERAGIPVLVIDEADDSAAVRALASHVGQERPDVLHLHMYRAEVVGIRAALALEELGQPRPYLVSTVHSSRIRSAEDRETIRLLTPRLDQLIAVSRAIVAKLEHEGRTGVPTALIYNGVDLQRYDHQEPCCTLREEYGMEAGSKIVGTIARLEQEKGHPTLLEAWPAVLREVPDAYLLVVGEGSERPALEQIAADLHIAHRVVFAGRRDDVPAVTAALDVAVLPSYREAQGLAVLEAMALSRPVVASNVGGIPEMIEDGRTGLLVPPHDPPALAAAIVRLLLDHPYADVIARNGHELVHERFCVELMVNAVEEIYDGAARTIRPAELVAS